MNYYPYFNSIPYASAPIAKTGILKSLFGGIKWSSILNGTQKTLGIVNQAIPLIKQAGPVLNNAKTMFKVMNEFKKTDIQNVNESVNNMTINDNTTNENIINKPTAKIKTGPTFFQ